MVAQNLQRVRERIAAAARAAGRDPGGVRLIAVTKTVPVERVREAIAAGVSEIGENRVQEGLRKQELLGRAGLRWHLIGRLQGNKVKPAAQLFDVIHSVDSPDLIEGLEKQLVLRQAQHEQRLEVLIQVNVSGEATKGGCRPEQAEGLAEALLRTRHLRWTGLMTMAPFSEDPEAARPFFRRLRELREALEKRFSRPLPELSMGMSGDFEAAVREGATMVRVGTAIFGERQCA